PRGREYGGPNPIRSKIEILALIRGVPSVRHVTCTDTMAAPGQTTIIRKKRRRRRRRKPIFPVVLMALGVVGVFGGGVAALKWRPKPKVVSLPEGYVSDRDALRREYERYYGNDTDLRRAEGRFTSAADLAGRRNLPGVTSVLESVTK